MREHYLMELEKAKHVVEFIDSMMLKSELNLNFETVQFLQQQKENYKQSQKHFDEKLKEMF